MKILLFQIRSYSTSNLLKSARSIIGSSFYHSNQSRIRNSNQSGVKSIDLRSSVLSRFAVVHCYSSKRRKRNSNPEPIMNEEKDAFFVVRKGDIVGVYKTLSECQSQIGSSVTDPPVSVFKGYLFPKDAEEHLMSHGLQNALYTIKASDLKDDLFGTLEPCLFQPDSPGLEDGSQGLSVAQVLNEDPLPSKGETSSMSFPQKRPLDVPGSQTVTIESSTIEPLSKHQQLKNTLFNSCCCILEFDGASKGNPGQSGAGAVLRALNGSVICKIRQGLGIATNNVAEYRAMILGLKKALELGYTSIQAQGDSKLVCMQIQGLWKIKNQNMYDLHAEAKKLKDKFSSFQISHVLRDLNSDADAQANLAVTLADGQVQEELC